MDERLNEVLRRARLSPFYEKHLAKATSWDAIAPTTKAHLRQRYPFGMLAVPRNQVATYHESSGTEGKPIASCFSDADWDDITSRFLRGNVELSSSDVFFVKTPYSMVTTAHQAHLAGRRVGAMVVPADNRSTNMPYSRVVQLISDLGVTVTWSLPTEVVLWTLAAEQNGYAPSEHFSNLRAFWVAGETLSEAKRDALSRLWGGKRVVQDYGSTETGSLAGECAHGNLHLWSDRVFFEVLDPTSGEIRRSGRGQLLVTPLYRTAMPLVRYLIEDIVDVSEAVCPCGGTFPTVKVWGRSSGRVEIQGKSLFPVEVEEALYRQAGSHHVLLWRGRYDQAALDVEYYALDGHWSGLGEGMSQRLGIPVRARAVPLSCFIDGELMTESLKFSKPQFLFPRRNHDHREYRFA